MATVMAALEELDRGWSWVVLISTFGYFMVFGLFLYGVGVVHLALLEEYHAKSATTAWVGGIFAALISLCGPLSSVLIDRLSCRSAMFLDGILTSVGCVTTALCPNIYCCILTYGIIAGLGGGIGYTASIVVIGFNFRKFRPVAMTAALSGIGIGTFVFSPAMEAVRESYGNAGYFIIIGGVALHKCIFALLCKPSRLELERQRSLKEETKKTHHNYKILVKHYAKVYANKAIICFSLSLLLFAMDTYMIFLHLPTYSIHTGYSPMSASWLLACCGICTVLSRILTDISTHRKFDEIVLYSGSFGTLALGTFLFPLYSKSYGGQLVFSILLGAYFGGCYAIINSINIKIVGVRYLSIATGIELLFSGIGTFLGPVITGLILDKSGTYEQCFMVAAFLILIAAGLGMATVLFQPEEEKPEVPNLDLLVADDGEITIESKFAQISKEDSPETNTKTEDTLLSNSSTHQKVCYKNPKDSPIIEREIEPEPINFTEEIQKLLKGEELQFIDES